MSPCCTLISDKLFTEQRVCFGSQLEDIVYHTGKDTEARASQDGHITTTDRKQRDEHWHLVGCPHFLLLIPCETQVHGGGDIHIQGR